MAETSFDIGRFCERMEKHIGDQNGPAQLFWKALSFAVNAHQDQKRKSGEAYVSHPCQVAMILVEEMGITDPETLAAAVLHDTVEDVPEVTEEVIGEIFGKDIAAIVDGCTKITHFAGDRQTFYKLVHRKIFSGAASRLDIMLIKLADRLHNLRTLSSMPRHKRQKIADETLSVYAPMAALMGLYGVKRELYTLALLYKFPRQGHKLLSQIRNLETSPEAQGISQRIETAMKDAWINGEVKIRAKGLSTYYDSGQKVLGRDLSTPVEVLITVDDLQSCYRLLGIVNQYYPPIPRTIRDFIANPKPTGYQCLHTKANIRGQKYLFKIRTREMINMARTGILAEWSAGHKMPSGFEKELRETFDILGGDEDISYREIIAAGGKTEIYTYTPKGDRICLPRQSIVLDFAYRVHTEVGNRCLAAVIGKDKVGPDHVLLDGDQVRVITQKEPVRFEPQLQSLCQTPKARSSLARMFRLRREALAREIGAAIIRQELKRYGLPHEILQKAGMTDILEYFDLADLDELFLQVGEGGLRLRELIFEIKNGLYAGRETLQPPTGALNRIELTTLDPACVKFSRCCSPNPTDKGLYGLLSERGLSVHRKECATIRTLQVQREDVVELLWRLKETRVALPQSLLVLSANRNRLLMMLGAAPGEMRITNLEALTRKAATQDWDIVFEVENLAGLKNVLTHFKKLGIEYEFVLEY